MPTMVGLANHEVMACEECTQMCLLIHQQHDPSPIVSSFFKIMFGDRYSDALFLPPIFARKLASLVDKEIRLEDSCGRSWKVTLSKVDSSHAFQQGWHAFASDHGIELGDLLMFYYITGSHFVVHIYGRSACQKPNLLKENRNEVKRTILSRDSTAEDGPCNPFDKDSRTRECSNTLVVSESDINIISADHNVIDVHKSPRLAENVSNAGNSCRATQIVCYEDEQYFMIDRENGFIGDDNRNDLLNLSCFEMVDMKSYPCETNEALINDDHANSEPGVCLIDEYQVAREDISKGAFKIEMVNFNDVVEDTLEAPEKKRSKVCGTKTVPVSDSEMLQGNRHSGATEHETGKGPCGGSLMSTDAIRSNRINLDYMDNTAVSTCKGIERKSTVYSGKEGFSKVKNEHDRTTICSQNIQHGTGKAACGGNPTVAIRSERINLDYMGSPAVSNCKGVERKSAAYSGKEGFPKVENEHDPTHIRGQNIQHGTGKALCRGDHPSTGAIRHNRMKLDHMGIPALSNCKGIKVKSAGCSGKEGLAKVENEHDPTPIHGQNIQHGTGKALCRGSHPSTGKEGLSKVKNEHDRTTICSQNIQHGTGKAACGGNPTVAIRSERINLDYMGSPAVSNCKGVERKSAAYSGKEGFPKVENEHDPTHIRGQNIQHGTGKALCRGGHPSTGAIRHNRMKLDHMGIPALSNCKGIKVKSAGCSGKEGLAKVENEHDPTPIHGQNIQHGTGKALCRGSHPSTGAIIHNRVELDHMDIPALSNCKGIEVKSAGYSGKEGLSKVKNEHDPTIIGSPNGHQKLSGISELSKFSVPTGKSLKSVKEEHIKMLQEHNQADKSLKPEPVDLPDSPPPLVVHFTCEVSTDSENFLELPVRLPSIYRRKRPRMEQQIIYMRDPTNRLWPVRYHEKYDLKVLVDGWPEFRKANGIRPGDKCTFFVENNTDSIFRVQIIRTS